MAPTARQLSIRAALIASLLGAVSGCAHRTLPGTEIPDTRDTRAIVDVIEQYRQALERKDPEALYALLSAEFRDTAGTGTPTDDLLYRDMREVLTKRLAQVEGLKASFNIRTIEVDGAVAQVVYHYDTEYQLPQYKTRSSRNSDLMRMYLKRDDGGWKILSGI